MPDMLVKLYELPDLAPHAGADARPGNHIRRALPPERHVVTAWVEAHFNPAWASEAAMSLSRLPVSCFLALEDGALLGFACYDATAKGFFGPTGVAEAARGRGTGTALLLACLHALYAEGYAYGIIGAAGPTAFYEKVVGAITIPGSAPGIYRGLLH